MEEALEAPPAHLVAFAELATELVGRAVTACTPRNTATTMAKKVKVELMQSAHQPDTLLFKVSDEGMGLPQRQAALQRVFHPLRRALSNIAVGGGSGTLLLRTTLLEESIVRKYYVMPPRSSSSSSSAGAEPSLLDILPIVDSVQEVKPPGLQLSGTQASIELNANRVPPSEAIGICEQILDMLCTLCPPVHLTVKAQGLILPLPPPSQGEDHRTTQTAPPLSFTRHLEPLPLCASMSHADRMKTALLAEFAAATPIGEAAAEAPQLFTFVAAGEAAIPRGCKWGASAAIVLQLPADQTITAQHQNISTIVTTSENSPPPPHVAVPPHHQQTSSSSSSSSSSVYIFKSHALQMVDRSAAAEALRKCDWLGHGFSLLRVEAAPSQPGSITVVLHCEQPASCATIPAIAVHLHLLSDSPSLISEQEVEEQSEQNTTTSRRGPPKLAERHEKLLVRWAVDAALADLKRQCPGVVSNRRERSEARALPAVSAAVAAILMRSVGGQGVLSEACAALGCVGAVSGEHLESVLRERLEEVVVMARMLHEGDLDEAEP